MGVISVARQVLWQMAYSVKAKQKARLSHSRSFRYMTSQYAFRPGTILLTAMAAILFVIMAGTWHATMMATSKAWHSCQPVVTGPCFRYVKRLYAALLGRVDKTG